MKCAGRQIPSGAVGRPVQRWPRRLRWQCWLMTDQGTSRATKPSMIDLHPAAQLAFLSAS